MSPAQRKRQRGRNQRRAELARALRHPFVVHPRGSAPPPDASVFEVLAAHGVAAIVPSGPGTVTIVVAPPHEQRAQLRAVGVAVPRASSTLTTADRAECKRIAKALTLPRKRPERPATKRNPKASAFRRALLAVAAAVGGRR